MKLKIDKKRKSYRILSKLSFTVKTIVSFASAASPACDIFCFPFRISYHSQ